MAWSAPMTATANTAFTAAQFNTYVRDNLLETGPAKATTAGRIFVSTGANAIAERVPSSNTVSASEGTTSTGFTDLATTGPTVTVTTGTRAIWFISMKGFHSSSDSAFNASVTISGASSITAADDARRMTWDGLPAGNSLQMSLAYMETGLTAGSNTFTVKYKTFTAGTASFALRHLLVIPL